MLGLTGSAVALAPIVLTGIGFCAGGIAAGSTAAGMMSAAAIANGGGVAAGSLVAILQSAGKDRTKDEQRYNISMPMSYE